MSLVRWIYTAPLQIRSLFRRAKVEADLAEVGIRMALGAQRRDIFVLILQRVSVLVVVGLLAGSVIAFAGSRVLGGLLFGIKPADPLVFTGATLMLLVAAALATCLPARRALQVNPSVALRHD